MLSSNLLLLKSFDSILKANYPSATAEIEKRKMKDRYESESDVKIYVPILTVLLAISHSTSPKAQISTRL